MKRLRPLALLLAMLVLGGCTWQPIPDISSTGSSQAEDPPPDGNKYRSAFENNWQYRYLNEKTKACYGTLYTVLTDQATVDEVVTITDGSGAQTAYTGIKVPLPHPLTDQAEASALYNAFFKDNPQFFYVGSLYGLEGYMRDEQAYYDTLVLVYTMGAQKRKEATAQLKDAVQQIVGACRVEGDAYTTELQLHDRLAQLCSYDDTAAKEGYTTHPNAFNAYGALVEGNAVCEGYARSMQLLLHTCDIPATLVTGTSRDDGEEHMWNLVTINGQNYHLDPTWDDSEDQLRHTYFNLSTAMLERTHKVADNQVGVDTCTATADQYFRRSGLYIDTYDRDTIARCVAEAYRQGKTVIELQFAPGKYDNGLLFLKNRKLTALRVQSYLPEGYTHLWEYELLGESDQNILTLVKKKHGEPITW